MKFADGDPITAAKHEMQAKGYITIKTPSFVQKVQKITDKRPGKSIRTISKDSNVSVHHQNENTSTSHM